MKIYLYAEEWRGRLNVESMRAGDFSFVLGCCAALRARDKKEWDERHWPDRDPIANSMYRAYEFDTDKPDKPRLCNKDILKALGPAK